MTEFYTWVLVQFKDDDDGSRTFTDAEVTLVNNFVLRIKEDGVTHSYPTWVIKHWHGIEK